MWGRVLGAGDRLARPEPPPRGSRRARAGGVGAGSTAGRRVLLRVARSAAFGDLLLLLREADLARALTDRQPRRTFCRYQCRSAPVPDPLRGSGDWTFPDAFWADGCFASIRPSPQRGEL